MVSVHIEYLFNSIGKANAVMLLGNRSVVFKSGNIHGWWS